ncbi:hypothetical protein ACVWXQ_007851 [Bradyrhizobium sp. S3.14.4]
MSDVARFTARVGDPPTVTMTFTLSRTNSVAISLERSVCPSAERYSIATVRPAIQPSSRNRSSKSWADQAGPKNPMMGSFLVCSARAGLGPITAATPTSVMNSRRLIELLV